MKQNTSIKRQLILLKTPFVMYAKAESLLEKISTCDNIHKNLTQQK